MTLTAEDRYNKATDPYRVSERHVRRVVRDAPPIDGRLRIVDQGRFRAGDHTCYAAVAVITEELDLRPDARRFAVHTAIVKSDGPFEPAADAVMLQSGDYCLTFAAAQERLGQR